jgi:hypothetical protein
MASALRNVRGFAAAFAAAAALAGGLMAATVPGCTVLTNDALPDDAGTFEASTADAASNACGSCVALECVGPWAVCLGDEGCQKLRACDNPFTESEGARLGCFCQAPAATDGGGAVDPLAAYAAFASCNDAKTCAACASDCTASCAGGGRKTTVSCAGDAGSDAESDASPTTDAGDAGTDAGDSGVVAPEVPSVDGCAACVSGRCDAAKKLCAIGSECAAFLACAKGCGDAACVTACGASHSTGKASAMELSSCTLTSCRSACGL